MSVSRSSRAAPVTVVQSSEDGVFKDLERAVAGMNVEGVSHVARDRTYTAAKAQAYAIIKCLNNVTLSGLDRARVRGLKARADSYTRQFNKWKEYERTQAVPYFSFKNDEAGC